MKFDLFLFWLKLLDKIGIKNPWEQRAISTILVIFVVILIVTFIVISLV